MRFKPGIPAADVPGPSSWTKQEMRLLGTDIDSVIAARLGRNVLSVTNKRRKLGSGGEASTSNDWTRREIRLLGMDLDFVIAAKLGRTTKAVATKRHKLGITPACTRRSRRL